MFHIAWAWQFIKIIPMLSGRRDSFLHRLCLLQFHYSQVELPGLALSKLSPFLFLFFVLFTENFSSC